MTSLNIKEKIREEISYRWVITTIYSIHEIALIHPCTGIEYELQYVLCCNSRTGGDLVQFVLEGTHAHTHARTHAQTLTILPQI